MKAIILLFTLASCSPRLSGPHTVKSVKPTAGGQKVKFTDLHRPYLIPTDTLKRGDIVIFKIKP
jgi:hypothetical protein